MVKQNLTRSFRVVVGLRERFQESLLLVIASFDWRFPFMRIARLRRIVPRLNRAVIGAIGEHNRFDIELYDFPRSSLKKACAGAQTQSARD